MPEDVRSRAATESQYRDLVRLAYFVLPGKGKRFYRLAVAQRVVDGVMARRGDVARQRTRVLRRSMRPSWRLRVGLGPWLRALPAKLPDPALTKALASMEPRVRVAYVLRHIEGLPRYEVRDQLIALRVRDAWSVIDDADAADLPAIARSEPFEPAPVRRPRRRPVLPLAAATLTTALIGTLIVTESGGSVLGGTPAAEARNVRLMVSAPDAWTRRPHSLDVWPARGDLAADRAFTGRALDAWAGTRRPGARRLSGEAQLLFAGRINGTPTALLRQGAHMARYTTAPPANVHPNPTANPTPALNPAPTTKTQRPKTPADPASATKTPNAKVPNAKVPNTKVPQSPAAGGAGGTGGGGSGRGILEVFAVSGDASNPIALGGGRYLLAPWDKGATTPAGRKVAVAEGVTAPVTVRTRCGRGPLLDITGGDGARTVGEFGGLRPVVLTYRSSTATAPAKPAKVPAKPARLKTSSVEVWDRLGCLLPAPTRPVAEAGAWTFWTGSLPHGGGKADWACGGFTYADGGTVSQAALLADEEEHAAGMCDPRRPAGGTWWQAPSDRWYYVAAAARGLTPRATGPVRRPEIAKRLLVGSAPKPAERPSDPVVLTARTG
ncbi:hypothetical protein [Spirillospora sp. NPDC047279]|uniref:hypothetical protein n=1 Tax=Spirillospora sp. NPDC047279 TaxID=3155478 RepID=UPI0033D976D3